MIGLISENSVDIYKLLDFGKGNIEKIKKVKTPFGTLKQVYYGKINNFEFYYVPYTGICEGLSLTKSPAAILSFFNKQGIKKVVSVGLAGAINPLLKVGDIITPTDIIDFTKGRVRSILEKDNPGVHFHFRSCDLFCPSLRNNLIQYTKKNNIGQNVFSNGTYAACEGPRFETPAEIKALSSMGADCVGLTIAPEVYLARELGMCYANLSIITNIAEGLEQTSDSWADMKHISKEYRREYLAKVYFNLLQNEKQIASCKCQSYWYRKPTHIKFEDELNAK